MSNSSSGRPKKRAKISNVNKYLQHIPTAQSYEVSYAHRDVITGICMSNVHAMLISASADGIVKFWKRTAPPTKSGPASESPCIEFVKSYQSHSGPVICLTCNAQQNLAATISTDNVIKFYDVANFDVSGYISASDILQENNTKLAPHCCFIDKNQTNLAIGTTSGVILICDSLALNFITSVKLHGSNIVAMKYNILYGVVISADSTGVVEVWRGDEGNVGDSPDRKTNNAKWSSKMATDLYHFMKNKTKIASVVISKNGQRFAILDNKFSAHVYDYFTCKILCSFDESVANYDPAKVADESKVEIKIDQFEYGKRCAVEAEIFDTNIPTGGDITDESVLTKSLQKIGMEFVGDNGRCLVIPNSGAGLTIYDTITKSKVQTIGSNDASQLRYLTLELGDSNFKLDQQTLLAQTPSASNLAIDHEAKDKLDPLLIATCFNKKRIYLFSNHESNIPERDILNEPPEIELTGDIEDGANKLATQAILRTTMGDIHLKLFPDLTPKTVENFVTHARNGYYDDVVFHRVIKGFMIQTGDPLGDGTGGESIWGGEFPDEFHRTLRHDRPFTLSMANAGPNTNGSQFFITTVPTPWLDSKHTVFGRVVAGMDVVSAIENVKADDDRPIEDISISSVDITD
mmetsp:Transcript_20904/g.31181  ORF Transcript_20904/g.31181 Transcript_20904/m.31181 type:complete len:633 (-) Transcript_20904:535-2433(-)